MALDFWPWVPIAAALTAALLLAYRLGVEVGADRGQGTTPRLKGRTR
jgi:hypothetical protein